jgi:hypothetical protein
LQVLHCVNLFLQLLEIGHDPALLGERGNSHPQSFQVAEIDVRLRGLRRLSQSSFLCVFDSDVDVFRGREFRFCLDADNTIGEAGIEA